MRPTTARRLRRAAKAAILYLAISLTWALLKMTWPPDRFTGSPPRRYAAQRNGLDFREHGRWYAKFGKTFRPSGFGDVLGPALLAAPIVHFFAGWDVYADHACVEGVLKSIDIAEDDGDVGMHVALAAPFLRYSWRRNHPEDGPGGRDDMVVEVDEWDRGSFPILPDLAPGDRVRVCGRWVYDRGHDHNEIHPARWIQFIDR